MKVHVCGIDIGKTVFHLVCLSKEGHIVQKKRRLPCRRRLHRAGVRSLSLDYGVDLGTVLISSSVATVSVCDRFPSRGNARQPAWRMHLQDLLRRPVIVYLRSSKCISKLDLEPGSVCGGVHVQKQAME